MYNVRASVTGCVSLVFLVGGVLCLDLSANLKRVWIVTLEQQSVYIAISDAVDMHLYYDTVLVQPTMCMCFDGAYQQLNVHMEL